MFLFRRIFRWSFSAVAIVFLRTAVKELATPYRHPLTYIASAADVAVALVFIMAWWTTRKSAATEGRRFAVAASILHLLLGSTAMLAHPPAGLHTVTVTSPGLLSLAFGLVGILVFSRATRRTGSPAAQLSASSALSASPGDATAPRPSALAGIRTALASAGEAVVNAIRRVTGSYGRASLSAQATQEAIDRYRDRNLALLRSAAEAPAATPLGLGLHFDLTHYFEDRGMFREARNAFIRAEHFQAVHNIETSPEHLSALVLGNALLKRNPAVARRWFDALRAADPKRRTPDYAFAESAVLWLERRLPEANDAWQKANEAVLKLGTTANAGFHADRCARLRFELDALAERQRVADLNLSGVRYLPATPMARLAPTLEGESLPANLAGTQDRRRRPRTPEPAGRNMWPRPSAS